MKSRNPILGAFWLIAQPLALNVLTVPATALIIRKMGATGYGLWGVSATLIAATLFLTNLGVRTLFVRAVAQHPERASEYFAEQLGLRTTLACLAGLVAIAACFVLRYPPVVLSCTLVGVLGLTCSAAASSVSDLLYATQRLGESAAISFIQGSILTAASVGVALAGWGPLGLSWAYLLGPLTSAVLSILLVQRRFFPVRIRWCRTRFLKLLRESRALAAQSAVGTLAVNAESLLVPKLLGVTAFGYFSAGLLPASRLTVVSDGLSTAFFPIIARKWVDARREAAWEGLRFWLLSVSAHAAMAVAGALLAAPAAAILFPKNPEICRMVISISVWGLPFYAGAEAMAYCLNASGNHGLQARIAIVAVPIGLAVTAILIWKLGILGACWSWVVRPAISLLAYSPAVWGVFGRYLLTPVEESETAELALTGPAEAS